GVVLSGLYPAAGQCPGAGPRRVGALHEQQPAGAVLDHGADAGYARGHAVMSRVVNRAHASAPNTAMYAPATSRPLDMSPKATGSRSRSMKLSHQWVGSNSWIADSWGIASRIW